MNATKMTVKEVLAKIEANEINREAFQRTPSHTDATAKSIIDGILDSGELVGVLSLATMEDGQLSLVDGGSRMQDFAKLKATAKIGKVEYTIEQIEKLLDTEVMVVTYDTFNSVSRRADLFHKLNGGTALTGVQKHRTGDTIADEVTAPIARLVNLCGGISDRIKQKDIAYKIAIDFVLAVNGKYTGSAGKQVQQLADCTINNANLARAVNSISEYLLNNDENSVMPWGLTFSLITLYKNSDFVAGSWIETTVPTAGANAITAVDKGTKRFCKLAKAYTKAVHFENVADNSQPLADTL